jgi:hypothetical protein
MKRGREGGDLHGSVIILVGCNGKTYFWILFVPPHFTMCLVCSVPISEVCSFRRQHFSFHFSLYSHVLIDFTLVGFTGLVFSCSRHSLTQFHFLQVEFFCHQVWSLVCAEFLLACTGACGKGFSHSLDSRIVRLHFVSWSRSKGTA